MTEPDGPASPSPPFPPPPPPPPPPRRTQRPRGFCPSCTHRALPFYLRHPEHLCNGARGDVLYHSVQQGEPEPPFHLDAFHNKLGFWHTGSPTHSLPHSFSTDVWPGLWSEMGCCPLTTLGLIPEVWFDTRGLVWYQRFGLIPAVWFDTSCFVWYQRFGLIPAVWFDTRGTELLQNGTISTKSKPN